MEGAPPSDLEMAMSRKTFSVDPLPSEHRKGLIAISVPAFISLFACCGLAAYLARLIVSRRRKHRAQNQLAVLVFNLMLANIQQSLGFLLEAHWLQIDRIDAKDTACWAQGFLVSAGSVACVLFSFAISLYTFVLIVFRYQVGALGFYLCIFFFWLCIYIPPLGPVFAGLNDWFVPQGVLCMMNDRQHMFSMYLHFLWIIIAEFLSIVLYVALFVVMKIRIKRGIYQGKRARKAIVVTRLMFLFPAAYFACTIPLIAVPILISNGTLPTISYVSAACSLWACIGWIDVLLYSMTRRFDSAKDDLDTTGSSISSLDPLDTFDPWWFTRKDGVFGTTTTIEAAPMPNKKQKRWWKKEESSGTDDGGQTHRKSASGWTLDSSTGVGTGPDIAVSRTVNVAGAPISAQEMRYISRFDRGTADEKDGVYDDKNVDEMEFASGHSFLNV